MVPDVIPPSFPDREINTLLSNFNASLDSVHFANVPSRKRFNLFQIHSLPFLTRASLERMLVFRHAKPLYVTNTPSGP